MSSNTVTSFVVGGLLAVGSAVGQDYPSYPQQQQQQPQYQSQYQSQAFAPQQLDDLVAPIALYPDSLLSQVLVASTYPSQLTEASQWLAQNGSLQGQSRIEYAQQQNWDPSVQALVAFPDVVQKLTQDVRWTTDLGNAFLAQEGDVMSAVQRMRQRAQQSGRLTSNAQQRVNVDNQYGEPVIEIQPANPEVVYVPTYNPAYIWGAPSYGYYPSLYYPSYGYGFGSGIYIGSFFGGWGSGRLGWGWGPRWHERSVFVNNNFFDRYRFEGGRDGRYAGGNSVWSHDYARGNRDSFGRSNFNGTQQRGFSGNYAGSNTGNNSARSFGRSDLGRQQAPVQQPTQQVAPRSFTGNYGGASNTGRGFNQTVQPAPQAFGGNYRGNYGGGNTGRSFSQPQAPAQQAPQQQAPRSFSGGSNGGFGGNYNGNSRGFGRNDTPRQQAPQQQHISGGSNFRSAPAPSASRNEGGHRR